MNDDPIGEFKKMSIEGSPLSDDETRTNLIINYLPQNLTDQEFYKIFAVVGSIKNCRVMKDLKTGYSFGFGFVEYQKPEDAAKAILKLNNSPVQHKRIKVSYARPPGEDLKETNLYIQNIPRGYTLDQLEDLFSPYGQIVQKNLLKDKITGLPRGVGFVRYEKKSEADAAIDGMNGITPEGANEPLVVKIAEEHGKMKAAYYAGYHAGRGRGYYNNRGGGNFGRGGGGGGGNNYNMPGGKITADRERGNTRYNPIGSGGGYGGGFGTGGGSLSSHDLNMNTRLGGPRGGASNGRGISSNYNSRSMFSNVPPYPYNSMMGGSNNNNGNNKYSSSYSHSPYSSSSYPSYSNGSGYNNGGGYRLY